MTCAQCGSPDGRVILDAYINGRRLALCVRCLPPKTEKEVPSA